MKLKKNGLPQCDCKSEPEYHKDDCEFYDSHGNLKSSKPKVKVVDILSGYDLDAPSSISVQFTMPKRVSGPCPIIEDDEDDGCGALSF